MKRYRWCVGLTASVICLVTPRAGNEVGRADLTGPAGDGIVGIHDLFVMFGD